MGLVALLAAVALLAGCNSAGASPPVPRATSSLKYGHGDGQTMATAVEIRSSSEVEGEVLVRDWILANYPGHVIQRQELIEHRDRAYQRITILGPGNSTQRVFFDISAWYRRIDSGVFPKPLS